jgi:hypothetical protein
MFHHYFYIFNSKMACCSQLVVLLGTRSAQLIQLRHDVLHLLLELGDPLARRARVRSGVAR